MTGLRLGLGIIMVLLAGVVCADEKNVRLVEAQQFAQGNKVAVVVGVNTYDQESGLRPLKYADADAQGLKQALEKHGYVVRLLTNQKATKSYILDAIKQAGEALNSQGTLIFAFSGHGFAQNNANYLASYGTVASDLSASALTMNELEQAVRNTRARRAVLFIDACRENPSIEGSRSIGQPSFIQQQSEGIEVLYATKFGDISWETPKLGHGVFSYFLQKALNGEAVDSDGAISFDNLKSYVQLQVANWTLENLAHTQMPYNTGDNYGIFMLASAGSSPVPQPVPAPKLELVSTPTPTTIHLEAESTQPTSTATLETATASNNEENYDMSMLTDGSSSAAPQLSPEPISLPPVLETFQPGKESTQSVSTATYVETVTPNEEGKYSIEIMASSDKAKAKATMQPLRADGYHAVINTAMVAGRTVYRVQVIGYTSREAAEAAQAKLKARFKQNQAIQGSFVHQN